MILWAHSGFSFCTSLIFGFYTPSAHQKSKTNPFFLGQTNEFQENTIAIPNQTVWMGAWNLTEFCLFVCAITLALCLISQELVLLAVEERKPNIICQIWDKWQCSDRWPESPCFCWNWCKSYMENYNRIGRVMIKSWLWCIKLNV